MNYLYNINILHYILSICIGIWLAWVSIVLVFSFTLISYYNFQITFIMWLLTMCFMRTHIFLFNHLADWCKNGVGRNTKNGRHWTVLRRITDCYEETVGRSRRANVLFPIKWISAQWFCKIVNKHIFLFEKIIFRWLFYFTNIL